MTEHAPEPKDAPTPPKAKAPARLLFTATFLVEGIPPEKVERFVVPLSSGDWYLYRLAYGRYIHDGRAVLPVVIRELGQGEIEDEHLGGPCGDCHRCTDGICGLTKQPATAPCALYTSRPPG
jgi:hypothetical protein